MTNHTDARSCAYLWKSATDRSPHSCFSHTSFKAAFNLQFHTQSSVYSSWGPPVCQSSHSLVFQGDIWGVCNWKMQKKVQRMATQFDGNPTDLCKVEVSLWWWRWQMDGLSNHLPRAFPSQNTFKKCHSTWFCATNHLAVSVPVHCVEKLFGISQTPL